VEVTRVIPAPLDRVWEVFTDLARRPAWLSDVESVEVLTPGPFGAGTRWRETRVGPDGPAVEELVVTAVATVEDVGRSCTIELADTGTGQMTYVFVPVEIGSQRGGTAVAVTAEARPHGLTHLLLAFFVGTFAARTAEGALREELDAFAAACVAGETAGNAA